MIQMKYVYMVGVPEACLWQAVTGTRGKSECSKCFAIGAGLHLMMQMKHVYQDGDKKCAPDLGLKMCFRTKIKHMDWNWDLTCVPRVGLGICTETGIKHMYGNFPWQPGRAQQVPWHRCKLKYKQWEVQSACLWQAG